MAEMISYYLMTEYGNFSRMEEFPFNSVFLQYTWNKKKRMQTHIRKANLGTGWELERKKMQADKDSLLLLISINLQV